MMEEQEEIATPFDPAKPHEEPAVDQYQIPEALREIVSDLKQQAWALSRVDDRRGVFALCCVWGVILATSALAAWVHHPMGYAIAFVVFASSQIALSVLVHEGAHQLLFSRPWVNAAAADLFLALPLGILTSRYQGEHPSHHSFPNHPERDLHWALDWGLERDFWQWPKSPRRFVTLFLRDMLFLNIRQNSLTFRRYCAFNPCEKLSRAEAIRLLAFVALVGLVLIEVEKARLLIVLWVACMPTLMFALLRFRTIAEHIAIPGKTGWQAIRHIRAPLIERLSFAPFNINHHIAHHLFPRVPSYNLPKLHALIEAHPQFKAFDGCVKESYLGLKSGVLGELIGLTAEEGTARRSLRVTPARAAESPLS
jgi:fatty acid desaturase